MTKTHLIEIAESLGATSIDVRDGVATFNKPLFKDASFERTYDSEETEDLQEVVDEEETMDSNSSKLQSLYNTLRDLEKKIADCNSSRSVWDDERLDTRESDREVFRDLETRAYKVRKIIERLKSKGSSHKTTDSIESWWSSSRDDD